MAVVYQTGTSTDPADLLAKLLIFAAANGWTSTAAVGGSVLSNGVIVAGIRAVAAAIETRGALGVNGAASWDAQTNAAGWTHSCNTGAGPFTSYHFFAGDEGGSDYLHVTIEVSAGTFRHWALGQLIKSGTYTGGVYSESTFLTTTTNVINNANSASHRYLCDANAAASGSADDNQVWIDYDAKVNNWQRVVGADAAGANNCIGSMRSEGISRGLSDTAFIRYNQRSLLIPLRFYAGAASSLRYPIGRMPGIRQVLLNNLAPAQEIPQGGDTWIVFPVFKRQTTSVGGTEVSSSTYGYAHLKDVA